MQKRKVKVSIVACVVVAFIFITLNFDFRLDRFGKAKISWSDCIQINNTKYFRGYNTSKVEASTVGDKIGEVTFNVSKKVSNPKYRFRNGDATFLDVGTEIYKIRNVDNAIAVEINEQYYLYSIRE
jgi:hypothetical protein